ncbi:MAG: hypothetical protein JNN30_05515 [Rhodanobacteraceae bacterium]|nr:hypothetical protein [Rhodanobacteraceae bacterium]
MSQAVFREWELLGDAACARAFPNARDQRPVLRIKFSWIYSQRPTFAAFRFSVCFLVAAVFLEQGCNSVNTQGSDGRFDETTQCWEFSGPWNPKVVREGDQCMEVLETKAECLVDGRRTWVPAVYEIPVPCEEQGK